MALLISIKYWTYCLNTVKSHVQIGWVEIAYEWNIFTDHINSYVKVNSFYSFFCQSVLWVTKIDTV